MIGWPLRKERNSPPPAAAICARRRESSSIICAWLERRHPEPALYPADADLLADALWLEEYADGTMFRELIHGLFFQQVIRPNILKQTTDKTIVAGFAPGAEGFFWLAGQGGYGIQTAPAMGRIAAALARREPLPADVAALGITPADVAPQRLR